MSGGPVDRRVTANLWGAGTGVVAFPRTRIPAEKGDQVAYQLTRLLNRIAWRLRWHWLFAETIRLANRMRR